MSPEEPEFHTRHPGFIQLLERAARAARTDAAILIRGESGTGKNRLARWIHLRSPRRAGPFVEVACPNLPAELLESELFGHLRGAFTGAHAERSGRFEQADGGTLFLDELQELAPELQAKILRAIEERRFERLGGGPTRQVDVRIIASTGEDPEKLVRQGRLREDLYYRLNVVSLELPPLRAREEDIMPLAQRFLEEAQRRHRLAPRHLSPEVAQRFGLYPWPGNVRELWHVIESAAILAEGDTIGLEHLPPALRLDQPALLRRAAERDWTLRELEQAYIREVLSRTRGNKSAAARILGVHRKTLHEKLRAAAEPSRGSSRDAAKG